MTGSISSFARAVKKKFSPKFVKKIDNFLSLPYNQTNLNKGLDRMKKRKISDAVIRRLPRYYRYLDDLHSKGIVRISSSSLGERMDITASQIRQDLSCFGEFGQQGYGYNIL